MKIACHVASFLGNQLQLKSSKISKIVFLKDFKLKTVINIKWKLPSLISVQGQGIFYLNKGENPTI